MKNVESNTLDTSLPCTNPISLQIQYIPWIENASNTPTKLTSIIVFLEISVKKQGKVLIVLPKSTHVTNGQVEDKNEVGKSSQDAIKGTKEEEPSKMAETDRPKEKETIQALIQLLSFVHIDALLLHIFNRLY